MYIHLCVCLCVVAGVYTCARVYVRIQMGLLRKEIMAEATGPETIKMITERQNSKASCSFAAKIKAANKCR